MIEPPLNCGGSMRIEGRKTMLKKVMTRYGEVEGIISDGGFALFKGIPYAAPPIGELRWKPSVAPRPWDGVLKCDTWGAACIQDTPHADPSASYGKEYYSGDDYPPKMSEDCLYLNIWTPAETGTEKLPVMMWMHGGGVQSGYSHEIEFDGDAICSRGVILVTINYRLNIFGYFAHPELSVENEFGASGNYGVHDQLQALRWIHENIEAFGGDPDNVTVFGQSGGGRSTQALSCSPFAKGLFRRAIVQSAGGIHTALGRLPREVMENRGVEFMKFAGCKNISELRAIPAEKLFALFLEYGSGPDPMSLIHKGFNISTGGFALPLSLEDALIEGKQLDLDYLLGCTTGDSRMGPMLESLMGWAQLQQEHGLKPAYLYRFEHSLPVDDPNDDRVLKGAFHSSELWYVFGTLDRCWRPMTDGDRELSRIMLDCWTNFAKTGDPNGSTVPEWRTYDNAAPELMRFDTADNGGCGMISIDSDGELRASVKKLMGRS